MKNLAAIEDECEDCNLCGYSAFPLKTTCIFTDFFSIYLSLGVMQRVIIRAFNYLMQHQILPAAGLNSYGVMNEKIHSLQSELGLDKVTDLDEEGHHVPLV